MNVSAKVMNPSDAAKRLGVSTKALRLYEQRGLIAPIRTEAGWRTYGPVEMARAAEIVSLRTLGLSLAQVARVLAGDTPGKPDTQCLEFTLSAHQASLEGQARELAEKLEKVRTLRTDLARGRTPTAGDLARMVRTSGPGISFDLPWPWGGERFDLRDIRPLTFITGPLGSGKTRLARQIAQALPGATFLGLERLVSDGAEARSKLETDPALTARVNHSLGLIIEDGATESAALTALLVALEIENASALVVDLIEQGLNQPTQEAFVDFLRRRPPTARPLFLMTRSCAILDMEAVGAHEAILFCPANHSPPIQVAPYPGSPGYEAVATCLAAPEVRARTDGVIAMRPRRA